MNIGLIFVGVLLFTLGVPGSVMPTVVAIIIALGFLVTWGYFVYYEGFREGQTPGKKRFGLRVVQEGGYPLTVRAAAIRNLLRIIDIQPAPSWVLGGVFMLLHPRTQRLGDMAAGSIVVRERPIAALPEEAENLGPPRMTDREYEVLHEYMMRRSGMERAARQQLATRLLPHFATHVADIAGHMLKPHNPAHADPIIQRMYGEESGRRAHAGGRAGSGSPAAAALLRRQRGRWADYDRLLARAREYRLAGLPEAEVSRFAALYREVAADLARARTYDASPDMLYNLERSVGSGHNLLYQSKPRSAARVLRWLSVGFPALVRRRFAVIMLATVLLYGPALVGFAVVVQEPARARLMVPPGMIARAEEGAEKQRRGEGYVDIPPLQMPVLASEIITNNVQVTFVAFAGGITAGVLTVLILLFNGVFLGAVAGLFHAEGLNLHFWSFVLPHGIIELTAICIAGGAGLWLGSAFVLPGRRTRSDALRERGSEAISLIAGTAMLLVIAGVIEGFISPSDLPAYGKIAFSLLTMVVLVPYLAIAGRGEAAVDEGLDDVALGKS